MKVVLLTGRSGLGNAGDTVEVKDGFGTNFLLVKGLAVLPTDKRAKEVIAKKHLTLGTVKDPKLVKVSKAEKRKMRENREKNHEIDSRKLAK